MTEQLSTAEQRQMIIDMVSTIVDPTTPADMRASFTADLHRMCIHGTADFEPLAAFGLVMTETQAAAVRHHLHGGMADVFAHVPVVDRTPDDAMPIVPILVDTFVPAKVGMYAAQVWSNASDEWVCSSDGLTSHYDYAWAVFNRLSRAGRTVRLVQYVEAGR